MSSVAEVPDGAVKLVEIDQSQLRQHVDGLVRDAVEDTLNALPDAEADALCSLPLSAFHPPENNCWRFILRGRGQVPLGAMDCP
jgi:hypothetical protein